MQEKDEVGGTRSAKARLGKERTNARERRQAAGCRPAAVVVMQGSARDSPQPSL